ncbi:hypothetical protein KC19_8G118500 [Ceratodon purpureus]|uniref:RIN4 pathogenic type III effector avirulence factor Avr cleavage site domain-containing protein n=1 Tax=Ceratodon purpureus TaxID=3225 RepID=A0A8T0GXX5_CERPU|nr:hypothetical protein KC19_8G118500 [Ceratodon purpureus]
MAGHVPKFGGQNAGNFTEVFALARTGGKAGSGDSGASTQEERPPARNARGAPAGRGGAPAGVAPRRVSGYGSGGSGSHEREVAELPRRGSGSGSGSQERESSTRSSQEGNRPAPLTRAQERENSGRGGRAGVQDSSAKGGRKPRNINEDYAGASHLPKFGDWNTGDAGEANYTVMFSAASKERQTGSAPDLGNKSAGRGSGDMSRNSYGSSKKPSHSWWCFS